MAKKRVKKYTLAEFKAWLEGIEEIQPDDWSPDVNQWKMIREKIRAIVEPKVTEPKDKQPEPTLTPPPWQPPPRPPQQAIPRSGQIPDPAFGGQQSALDLGDPEMTPAAKAALEGKLPSEFASPVTNQSTTSIIDTSKKPYDSNFI